MSPALAPQGRFRGRGCRGAILVVGFVLVVGKFSPHHRRRRYVTPGLATRTAMPSPRTNSCETNRPVGRTTCRWADALVRSRSGASTSHRLLPDCGVTVVAGPVPTAFRAAALGTFPAVFQAHCLKPNVTELGSHKIPWRTQPRHLMVASVVSKTRRNAALDLICPCAVPSPSALLIPSVVRIIVIM